MDLDGRTSTLSFEVTEADTAAAVGSGSLPVLGTPRLLAWSEAVTCAAIDPALDESETSVGTKVTLRHRAPSPVGAEVQVTARVTDVDGRTVRFEVEAVHDDGAVAATAEITRVVVNAVRFVQRLGRE